MSNIKLSHMNHWKTIPYKEIPNFREFYYEDKRNTAYYSDWDRILRYHNATNYQGIEIAPWDLPDMMALFGTPENFKDFAKERGVEISGMFHGAEGSSDATKFDEVVAAGKKSVDLIRSFGGKHMNMCPTDNYYGIGPLNRDQLRNIIKVVNTIGEYAVDNGIQVGLHNEFFCAINKDNHRDFFESTDSRYVFYCLDTAQIEIFGEDIVKFYEDYHDRICTFHLKDTDVKNLPDEVRYAQDVEIVDDGTRWFWEPGEGILDFEHLWQLLKKYKFKGWVTIETDGTPDLLASMALSSYYVNYTLAKIYK